MIENRAFAQDVVHFSQWNRKGFGLFQVLGKVVKISVLIIVYLLVAEPAEAQKELSRIQTGEETDVTLEEVEVKGQRISTSLADLARVVQVITKKEIAQSPYSSLQDLLDQELSLDIRQRGHEGIQADISIQGSTYEQVLVLVNGIPLNNPQTGHFNGDIPVPLQAVERIEVIEGGASRWLGPSAFAGAINIITNTNRAEKFQLKIGGGQNALFEAEATKRFGSNFKQILSVSHIQTKGYSENTDLESSKLYYRGEGNFSNISLHTQAGVGVKKFGANAFYTPLYPDQYEEVNHAFASVGLTIPNKVSFSQDVYFRVHTDEFLLFRYEAPSWYHGPNQHWSRSFGVINNVWWDNEIGRITLGIDYKNDGVLSTVLGNPLDQSYSFPLSDVLYSKGAVRQYFSLYGEQVWKSNDLLMVFGLMSNAILSDSFYFRVFPGADIRYTLDQNCYLYASANKSMRMPSFTEMYYSSPTNQGNPNLKPEEAWSAQTGFKWNRQIVQIKTNIFASYGKSLIDWSLGEGDEKWTTRNINNLFRTGFEIDMAIKPFSLPRWSGTRLRMGYKYLSLSQSSIDIDSRYLLDHLRNKLIVSLNIPITNSLQFGVVSKIQDRAGWFTDWTATGESYKHEFEPFTTTDLTIQYNKNRITVYANILNFFDVRYSDIGHVEQAGRWIRLGCKLSISD